MQCTVHNEILITEIRYNELDLKLDNDFERNARLDEHLIHMHKLRMRGNVHMYCLTRAKSNENRNIIFLRKLEKLSLITYFLI